MARWGFNFEKHTLSERILMTLAYFDVFGFGLNLNQLNSLILGEQVGADSNRLKIELLKLKDSIKLVEDKYYLINSKVGPVVDVSLILEQSFSRAKWFKYIPFVEFVAVCNYLPLGIADNDSDVDIVIVTKVNRIFMARIFTTVIIHLLGLRRHGKKIKGRFCLSFYVNEAFLSFEDLLIDDDIYFAYWVLAIYPIYGNAEIYNNIFEENENWLKKYFDGERKNEGLFSNERSLIKQLLEWLFLRRFGDFFESMLTKFFINRNNSRSKTFDKNASILVNSRRLKFHNNDRRLEYRTAFEERLKGLGLFE